MIPNKWGIEKVQRTQHHPNLQRIKMRFLGDPRLEYQREKTVDEKQRAIATSMTANIEFNNKLSN